MTTPERLRRRQHIEAALIIVIGLLMVVQAIYFNSKDVGQQECVQENFIDLSHALDARSSLTSRETALNKDLWLVQAQAAGLLKDPEGELTPKQQAEFQKKYVRLLLEYEKEITEIEQQRRDNPLPPYPAGTCSER